MVRRLLAILALCARVPATAEDPAPDCPGGQVVRGMAGLTCARFTADGGQSCSRASDCEGMCMADTRTCSKLSPQFGCFEILMDDGQAASLCVD